MEANLQKYSFKRKELSPDDQIRVLHEAYQFLIKKYKLEESVANASLMIQTLEREQKRIEKMAIHAENKKDEKKYHKKPDTNLVDVTTPNFNSFNEDVKNVHCEFSDFLSLVNLGMVMVQNKV